LEIIPNFHFIHPPFVLPFPFLPEWPHVGAVAFLLPLPYGYAYFSNKPWFCQPLFHYALQRHPQKCKPINMDNYFAFVFFECKNSGFHRLKYGQQFLFSCGIWPKVRFRETWWRQRNCSNSSNDLTKQTNSQRLSKTGGRVVAAGAGEAIIL